MPHKQLIQTPITNTLTGVMYGPSETKLCVNGSDNPECCKAGGGQNELLETAIRSLEPPGDEGAYEEEFHEQGP